MEVAAIEGKNGQFAISRVHSPESTDLRQVRAHAADLFNSNEVQDAIRNASGLAAFYSWTGTSDQKDDHLVLDTNGPGNYLVTGVDFESAFSWSDTDKGQIQDHGLPPAMNGKIDKSKVAEAVAKIEGISDEQIRQAVNANPDLPAAEKPRIADGLIERRSKLREKMKARGWLD